MSDQLDAFRAFREKMNARIHESGNLDIKRFFALDSRVYEPGALPAKTKELLGLVASLVLRCDDCITYHIAGCREAGVTRDELFEAFSVALVVGGSITIPHLRRAVATLDEIDGLDAGGPPASEPARGAEMTIEDWLTAAKADAERRGLPELAPLLDSLGKSMEALRAADWNEDADGESPRDEEVRA